MASAWVKPHNEVQHDADGGWKLCFQRVTYHYDDGRNENGYRFIWKDDDGNLRPTRGQARIPNAAVLRRLISKAEATEWFK